MNKRQTVWLIVRLIGVYFGYWAIVSLLSLIGAIYAYTSLPSANNPASKPQQTIQVNGISIPTNPTRANQTNPNLPGTENPADKAKSDALKEVLWMFFLTVIYGGIGFYLIRNGGILFSTLIREDLTDETEETISSAPAKPKEKTVTTLDLATGSPSKKEEVTSLNLSEYVPKTQQTVPPSVEKIEEKPAEILPEQVIEPEIFINEQKPMNETPEMPETEAPATEPVLADEDTTRMDYVLPAVEKPSETPNEMSNEAPIDEQKQ